MEELEQERIEQPKWRLRLINIFAAVKRNPIRSLIELFVAILVIQIVTLPYGDIRELRTKNPTETAFMREYAALEKKEKRAYHKQQQWISLKQIPQDAIDAVIVSEDGTFWTHQGFDWFEFRESLERDFETGRAVRGASTITQQLVKNLYLSSSKNPLRKIKEWIMTWYMEQQLPKARILELYLNVIEWGDGVYGIEAAAHYYFDKSASALTRDECARLAAIIPSPRRHRADVDSKYVVRRSHLILDRMDARGM